jgi:hypothetical protein
MPQSEPQNAPFPSPWPLRYKDDMKPRLAAALALLGWYLICPPREGPCMWGVQTLRELFGYGPGACNHLYPNYDAPTSGWENRGQFDHVDQCKREISGDISCRCVATDDPNLAK